MRTLLAHSLTAAAVMAVAAAPVPARADVGVPFNQLTVDTVGHVSADGWVTLSGFYRCFDNGSPGPVLIGTDLTQNGQQYSVNGSTATCDGSVRRWTNQSRPLGAVVTPGAAHVRATLVKLRFVGLLPLPYFIAERDGDIQLAPNGI